MNTRPLDILRATVARRVAEGAPVYVNQPLHLPRFTELELHRLLRHPDAYVRSMADWTKAYRGWGWRNITPHVATADSYESRLVTRLDALRQAGLESSPHYTIPTGAN